MISNVFSILFTLTAVHADCFAYSTAAFISESVAFISELLHVIKFIYAYFVFFLKDAGTWEI